MQQYQKSREQKVKTGDESMARGDECQNHRHTEVNSSENHQAHGDSDGESKVNFEKARSSQAETDHEVQGDRKVTRHRRGEQSEDRENTTDT